MQIDRQRNVEIDLRWKLIRDGTGCHFSHLVRFVQEICNVTSYSLTITEISSVDNHSQTMLFLSV